MKNHVRFRFINLLLTFCSVLAAQSLPDFDVRRMNGAEDATKSGPVSRAAAMDYVRVAFGESGDLRYTATSLRGVAEGLEAGEGSAGKLLKDDQLYNDLIDTTAEAKNLLVDVQERPGRYIHLSIF